MSDQNNCTQCELEVLGYLKDIPKDFRIAIAKAICKVKDESTGVQCSDVKNCETTTHLSPFTVNGTQVSVTYTNEDDVNETRSFNTGDLITSYFNALNPKCLDTQSHWDTLTPIQKLQLIIDGQCLCCNPPLCPVINNFIVTSGFSFDWDNSAVVTNDNVLGQRISLKRKVGAHPWTTGGFVPANDINKTIHHASNSVLDPNEVHEFKIETICGVGGPILSNNGIQEQITFQCIEPHFDVSSYNPINPFAPPGTPQNANVYFEVAIPTDDITRVEVHIRRASDDHDMINGFSVDLFMGDGIAYRTYGPLDVGVGYYIQARYYSVVNGVIVHSDQNAYLGAWCSSQVYTVPAPGISSTTTTTIPASTTSSTSTTSTSTTTTTTILCPAIAGMVASSNNGGGPTTTTTSTSTTTTHTTTTTTSTSTTSTSSTSSTSTTTTTTFAGGFDTQLTFNVSTTDSKQGVTGSVGSLSSVITFNFNKVTPRVGFPQTMNINVGGVAIMGVDFYSDYVGHTFRVIDSSGVGHNGNFTNGTVNF